LFESTYRCTEDCPKREWDEKKYKTFYRTYEEVEQETSIVSGKTYRITPGKYLGSECDCKPPRI